MHERPSSSRAPASPSARSSLSPLAKRLAWLGDPGWLRGASHALLYLGGFLLFLDLFIDIHAKVPGEGVWSFYSVIALAAIIGVVLGARWLGERMRQPDGFYHDAPTDSRGAGTEQES
ncbi:MAG: hypothetical protein CSB44_03905 [Gammaproteobacteria bacterium]|nr:MAG: hypothetical protein CSB44_03905 [Gammaproteobacteria bacterium]